MILEQIPVLSELTLVSILLRTFLAMLLGGILGYEREKRHRPAGFRTYLVVCLGSTLAMMVGLFIRNTTGSSDAGRIPAQVISGIGFLGAGTILVTRQNQVRGLTTAAGLWSVACLGLALGAGFYTGALVCFAAIWISVKMLRIVDRHLHSNNSEIVSLRVEFSTLGDMSNFIAFAKSKGCIVEHLEMSRVRREASASSSKASSFGASADKNRDDAAVISAVITLRFHKDMTFPQIVETYGNLEGVLMMETL